MDPMVFFISLGIGIFLAYVLQPGTTVVYKYPTPKNASSTSYVDDTGVCYKYNAEQVPKPSDESMIKTM